MRRYSFSTFILLSLSVANLSHASWICQNGAEVTTSGTSVTYSESGKLECIYKDYPMIRGEYYFELKVEDTDHFIAVGVTTENALNEQGFKGFFYDGDLTDGKRTLSGNFGELIDYYNPRETVGVIVKVNDTNMDMYLKHADTPLGLAFQIEDPQIPLFPAIAVEGTGNVTFVKRSYSSSLVLDRSKRLEGSYEINLFKIGDKAIEFDCPWKKITIVPLSIALKDEGSENDDNMYSVSYKGGKKSGLLTKENESWEYVDAGVYSPAVDASQNSECVQFIENVLENVEYFSITDKTVKVEAKQNDEGKRKSFQGKMRKSEIPKPLTQNIF